MATVDDVQRELSRHVGYRESGTNNTPFNRELGRIPGYPHDGFGYPWCHSFLSVGLKRAGLTPGADFPWTAGCLTGVSWFKARGRWGTTPRPGALVYYGPSGGTHVEWVEKVTSGSIVTIGGNTSGSLAGEFHNGDGVYRKTVARNSSRIYGYGYPDYEEDDVALSAADIKKISDAVYERFTHKVTEDVWAYKAGILDLDQRVDPRTALRQIWAYGKDGYHRDRDILVGLEGLTAAVKELAASRDGDLDVDAFMARITEAIEGVTVRLDVGGGE